MNKFELNEKLRQEHCQNPKDKEEKSKINVDTKNHPDFQYRIKRPLLLQIRLSKKSCTTDGR